VLSKVFTLTRSAHSLVMSASEAESSSKCRVLVIRIGVSWFQQRWRTQLSFVVITCTLLRSTTDSKSVTRLCPLTAHLHSVFVLEMLLQLVNADPSLRLYASTSSARKSNTLKVTSRKSSYFSEEARNNYVDEYF
jgi:lysylphosphatidylglycerol synthetase-like protein (DUF2156 family)